MQCKIELILKHNLCFSLFHIKFLFFGFAFVFMTFAGVFRFVAFLFQMLFRSFFLRPPKYTQQLLFVQPCQGLPLSVHRTMQYSLYTTSILLYFHNHRFYFLRQIELSAQVNYRVVAAVIVVNPPALSFAPPQDWGWNKKNPSTSEHWTHSASIKCCQFKHNW